MEKLWTLPEVLKMRRVSYATLSKHWKTNLFPKPLSGKGKKLVWAESQIVDWLHRHSTSEQTAPPNVGSPAKQLKQETKTWNERQKQAKDALARHAEGRRQNCRKPK